MKTTAVLLMLLSTPVLSQVTLSVYRAPSFTIDFSNSSVWAKPLDFIWKESKTLGFAVKINTSDVFALAAAAELIQYAFNVYPPFETPDPSIWRRGTVGDQSNVYRFFLDACVPTSVRENVQLTYSAGIGYIVEEIGGLRTTWGQSYGPDFNSHVEYPDNRYWVESFGLGITWIAADVLGFDFSTRYYTDYGGTLGITYSSGVVLQLGG